MKPKSNETKQEFLKRCTIQKAQDGLSSETAFSSCNRMWSSTNSNDGMLTCSDAKDFGTLVELAMVKDKMTVNEACESVKHKYPEAFKK